MGAILVTGGAGFIGGHFLRQLLRQTESRVVNLDLLTYAGNLQSLREIEQHPHYHFQQGDICNKTLVRRLLREYDVRHIVNFAAESHVDRSIDSPDEFVRTNVWGTATLLKESLHYWDELGQAARHECRFLQISSDEVYGSLGPTGSFAEASRYNPSSPYSASKASADHLVRAYHRTYGLPTLLSICCNNYGPYQFPEKLIPLMTLNAIEGRALPVYGDGGNVRDWLYVGDFCDALSLILREGRIGESYNVGGGAEMSNLEVVETICRVVDELVPHLKHRPCKNLIEFVEDRPGHDRRYSIDATKMNAELRWQPTTRFEEGIRKTVAWYLENSEWVEGVSSTYNRERLGVFRHHLADPKHRASSTEDFR